MPRTRDREFSPSVFEKYQRNEQALISTMLIMYIQGVSIRNVTKVVEAFLNRTLEKKYSFILSVVLYIKVRDNYHVVYKASHVVSGIDEEGVLEILSLATHKSESIESWREMYVNLLERRLQGLKLVTLDSHKGEVKVIRDTFLINYPEKNTSKVRDELKMLF